jgi:hypothetical protein
LDIQLSESTPPLAATSAELVALQAKSRLRSSMMWDWMFMGETLAKSYQEGKQQIA